MFGGRDNDQKMQHVPKTYDVKEVGPFIHSFHNIGIINPTCSSELITYSYFFFALY